MLVTDGDQRAALATVRSLGARGHRVYVCSAEPAPLAGGSRFAAGEAHVPDPLADPDAYVAAIRELIARWTIDSVIPISEPSLLAVLAVRETLGVLIPFPDLDAFRHISDKAAVMAIAPLVGISVPRQVVVTRPGDPVVDMGFPVVFKPARSISGDGSTLVKASAEHAADQRTLDRRLGELDPAVFPILVQERIVGPGVGIFLLRWDGQTVARFAHRRLREKPPSGGVSVYRESVEPAPDLVKRCEDLLDRFHWRGVAMIEFKLDRSSGEAYLMEINGRFWGSLQLAIDAGVDFPSLLLEVAAGTAVKPVTDFAIGVRSRWEWGDVDHVLARLRRSATALSLPADAPGRLRTLLSVARIFRKGDRLEILRLTDPGPFARESRAWLRALSGSRRSRRAVAD